MANMHFCINLVVEFASINRLTDSEFTIKDHGSKK